MPLETLAQAPLEQRFEELLADLLLAEDRGQRPDLSELLRTAPELETPLRAFFHNRAHFDRLAPRLAPTAASPAAPPEPPLPPPGRFGGYAVLDQLGQGGRGVVYRVSDPELNRPLAVKVLRPELRDEPDAARRFLEEAQVMGQLQHPGIVPVHAIGQLPDGRPYFAMKLVQGRTLAQLLDARPTPAHDLPRFLVIFQQVCQAVAYAHSRGVIHRDLKPANVMVGAFAEVQVMDWGLAKVLFEASGAASANHALTRGAGAAPLAAGTVRTVRTEATGLSSADGLVVGTLAYMAPEQAKGQVEQLDPRADVFGLGALLCEVLTGQPPFAEVPPWKLHLMAAAGDLADALARLDRCGADADLIALARDCLAPERERRPRDAGVVAERLATYLAEVQQRLRQAELEKAAAQARAEEARATVRAERQARQLTLGLAVAVLAVAVVLTIGGLWLQRQQAEEERQAGALRRDVQVVLEQAIRLRQGAHFEETLELLGQAQQRLGTDGPADLREQVEQALADTSLAARLDLARQKSSTNMEGWKLNFARTEQEYAAAFREAGLGSEGEAVEVVAARLRASAVKADVVAALDHWASITVDQPRRTWLLAVARLVDPDPERDRLRQPKLWRDHAALARLASKARVAELSPQLAAALSRALLATDAVPLLRAAQAKHPQDFWVNFYLGSALQETKEIDKAISYYRAAMVLRPRAVVVQINLGDALREKGWLDEAMSHWEEALRISPLCVPAYTNLGAALAAKERLEEAIRHYEKALRIDPQFADAHNNLGVALRAKGRLDDAIGHFEEALRIDPRFANAHYNLGLALRDKGRRAEAMRQYEEALRIDPNMANAHYNLGHGLYVKGRFAEAIGHFEEALRIDPRFASAHYNLGLALRAKGRFDEAIRHWEEALRIDPKLAAARNNIGAALAAKGRLEEAIRHYEKALHIDPNYAPAHHNLGNALRDKGRLDEAIRHYEEALRIDAKDAKAHGNLALALKDKGRLDGAIHHWEEALRLDPKDARTHNNLGVALHTLGRLDEAMHHYEEALRINPAYAETHGALGEALLALGRFADARDATRRCLDLLPQLHPMRAGAVRQLQRCEEALRKQARD
jgi:tetratricopeptide (TPR) repeat protein/tRNA A-37 threonylcarbamoyl transferase component Bud32